MVFKAISQEINIQRNLELSRYTTEVPYVQYTVRTAEAEKQTSGGSCPVNLRSALHIGFPLGFSGLPSEAPSCTVETGKKSPNCQIFTSGSSRAHTCNHRVGVLCRNLDPLFFKGDFNTSYRRVGGSEKFQIYCRLLLGPNLCACVPILHTFLVTLSLKKYV